MYTQCPNCATVFRVTADVLRAAQGEVRCGVCATSFDALEHLSEQPFKAGAEPAGAPDPADSMTVEELPTIEDIELSSANEIQALEAPESIGRFDPAAVAAQLSAAGTPPAKDAGTEDAPGDLERTDEYPILVLDERDEPEEPVAEEIVLESVPEPEAPAPEPPASSYTAPRILIPEEMRQRLAEEAAARAAFATDFGVQAPGPAAPRWPWTTAAAALLLALALQVIHSQRESLVRSPGIGALVAQAYALIGRPATAPTDLAAYELRQWGAASDPEQQGRLLLRASIVNRASFAQPYPLLRLALQDRFGATLGVRDIGPTDYLPGESQSKLLGPGERVDAEIRIVDPGQEAVGFEMDVCLPVEGGVRCANQITTAAQ
ncbi:MAG TPA: DUF3426 domain-containing protein [Steroidobacteraceae bacterium]|nr:DUF3426 domain-containing protein [Steroidobacteraceae bacterium]